VTRDEQRANERNTRIEKSGQQEQDMASVGSSKAATGTYLGPAGWLINCWNFDAAALAAAPDAWDMVKWSGWGG
jgi:hypothetical protein